MAKPVEQYLYLVPQRNAEGVISWMWIYKNDFGTGALPAVIAEKGSGKNDIFFTVLDTQNRIKFAGYDGPNVASAISIVEKGTITGKPSSISTGGEFSGVGFSGTEGTQLKLDNKNNNKKDFVYILNFVDSGNGNTPVTGIDPEIRNGGGTQGFDQSVYYAISAAIIGALLTVMFVRFALGWRRS